MTNEQIERLRLSAIVLRAQLGEDRAFVELWEMYNTRLSCFVNWIAGPSVEVNDVLQDIWLVVYQKITGMKSVTAFPAWLYSIARNRAYSARTRHARHERLLEHLHENGSQTPSNDVDELVLLEEVDLVRMCLHEIHPQHREVLLLRFLEDMSYQEIADAVGCTLGTVRSRVHYAKDALMEAMERKRHAQ